MTNWKASLKPAGVGAATGTAIGLVAFGFQTSGQHPAIRSVLFLLVRTMTGFSIAIVAHKPNSTAAAALLSVVGSLTLLVALGKEGPLCAVLAFPIILAGLFLGIGIGFSSGGCSSAVSDIKRPRRACSFSWCLS
jgi:hypothetical protein